MRADVGSVVATPRQFRGGRKYVVSRDPAASTAARSGGGLTIRICMSGCLVGGTRDLPSSMANRFKLSRLQCIDNHPHSSLYMYLVLF